MDRRQQIAVTVAILSAAIGVMMVVDPGMAAIIRGDTFALALVGLVMVILGYVRYRRAKANERSRYEPDTLEEYPPIATPGDTFDKTWEHHRFELAAIRTLVRSTGCSETEAEQMLHDASWTDDPFAAAYFSPYELRSEFEETRVWRRILLGQSPVSRRARAVDEIATLIDDPPSGGE